MLKRIERLPAHVANQIAAGEVVQRPASAVKELLENSLDAGATVIQLIVKEAGKSLVQVVDNGGGMDEANARLCFERHATSKIRKTEDLFDLRTMGFRGEALAAIGAVSQVELKTRMPGEETGICMSCDGGEVACQGPVAVEPGTSIAVRNLFFNIPARRQFLKSNTVEMKHITEEFFRLALVQPAISLKFFHNNEMLYDLPQSPLRQRIDALYGRTKSDRLIPVDEETEVVRITGFVVRPEHARKQRGHQYLFVNGRFFRSPYFNHAVKTAFEGLISEEHHPGYYLYLEVDPKSVDVNIHPTKTEVKFEDETTLYAILRSAVRHGLGKYHLGPTLDFQRDSSLDVSYERSRETPESPGIRVDYNFNPFSGNTRIKESGSSRTPVAAGDNQKTALSDLYERSFSSVEIPEEEDAGSGLFPDAERWSVEEAESFQWAGRYLVLQSGDSVYFVDQNRAHERVLYECFLAEMTVEQGNSQRLIFPLEVEVDREELDALSRFTPYLEHMGFAFGEQTTGAVVLKGLPAVVPEGLAVSLLKDLLEQEVAYPEQASFSEAEFLARKMSRKLAVPPGVKLEREASRALLRDLLLCKESQFSPYGKLVYIRVTSEEMDKKFK